MKPERPSDEPSFLPDGELTSEGPQETAWTGFMIASNEIPTNRRVDFDTTVAAMALTAREMNSKYKESSEGGLTVSVVLC